MKLDVDLLKQIVLALEENPDRFDRRIPMDGHTWEETDAHICALIDLDWVDGSAIQTMAGPDGPVPRTCCINRGLTTRGQLIALELRDDTFWNRVKEKAKKAAPTVTGAAIQALISLAAKG